MIAALLLLPLFGGAAAFLLKGLRARRALLPGTALVHGALTLAAWVRRPAPLWHGGLALDALGLLFLSIVSLLFIMSAFTLSRWLDRASAGVQRDDEEDLFYVNEPPAVFTGALLLFLFTMTWVCVCRHLGLLWVAVEATTLASAPLLYYHRHHRSLEATWKYLLICSVGIALALVGNFFVTLAGPESGGSASLLLDDLLRRGPTLHPSWLKAAFIFFVVGYGTKMGLAPLHTWLPDAHSEAPSGVSALLSGALLNCAFLALLRGAQVLKAAGLEGFAQGLFRLFGLLSLGVAAVFLLGQKDFKRLLAYSSVKHMGLMSLGMGLGGLGSLGALWHAVNHSLVKAALFLTAGNIVEGHHTKNAADVRGLLSSWPWTGGLWLAGLFAITGAPPFGTFLSELYLVRAAFAGGWFFEAAMFLVVSVLVFVGMSRVFIGMAQGTPSATGARAPDAERGASRWAPLCLLALSVLLGCMLPGALWALLQEAAASL